MSNVYITHYLPGTVVTYLCVCCMYVHMYIFVYMYTHKHIYIYIGFPWLLNGRESLTMREMQETRV